MADRTQPDPHLSRTAVFPIAGAWRLLFDVAVGMCVLTASAKVSVPFWPVPMTLQTLAVLMIGALQGRRAVVAVAAYLAAGALGMPVFANAAAGPLYMAGPTGGYLAGFLVAAAFLGRMDLLQRAQPLRSALSLLAAASAILLCGAGWLAVLIGPARAIDAGVTPFILAELVKAGIATATLILLASWQRRS